MPLDPWEELKQLEADAANEVSKEAETPAKEPVEVETVTEKPVEAEESTQEAPLAETTADPAKTEPEEDKAKKIEGYRERKRSQALEQELAQIRAEMQALREKPQQTEEPLTTEAVLSQHQQELTELRQERIKQRALEEVRRHVSDFTAVVPDAPEVIDHGFARATRAMQLANPRLSVSQIEEAVRMDALRIAAQAQAAGNDPAETLYNYYKELTGYAPKPVEQPQVEKPVVSEAKKLEAVQRNKAKSGSPLSATTGGGKALLSADQFMNIRSADEYMKLKQSGELDHLFR